MTITYLAYVPPVASMWADYIPSRQAADELGMSVDEVELGYAYMDNELVRERTLEERI